MTKNFLSHQSDHPQPSSHNHKLLYQAVLWLILVSIFLPLILTSCTSSQPPDPISVVQKANDFLNQDDVNSYMELFSTDAVMVDPHGTYTGSEAIRRYVEEEIVPQNYRFELSDFNSEGNDVTYTCKVFINDILRDTNTDGLDVVVDGKIIFEGTGILRHFICLPDPSQAFCPKE